MNALVTGGAGFIGSNLVAFLRRLGHDVAVLDNFTSGYRSNLAALPEVRVVEGDVRDPAAVRSAMRDADVVFHMAASVGNSRSIADPIEDSEVNVIGTLRVLEEARRRNVRKVVYSSSAGVFGELRTLPIAEDHPLDPDSPYGVSKLAGERHCFAYHRLHGLEVVALRYFNVYGPHQRFDAYGNVIPIFVHRLLDGEPISVFGDGEQTRDFINVADVVQANYKAAITANVSGVFNLGSGTAVTINELVDMVQSAAGLTTVVRHESPRPGDVRHSRADLTSIRAHLGFSPEVDFTAGLQEFVAWTRSDVASQPQPGTTDREPAAS